MAVNRELWQSPFYLDTVPPWPCPRCHVGTLELRDRNKLLFSPDAKTRAQNSRDNDAESESGAICCIVECSRKECREVCSISGVYYTEFRDDEDDLSSCVIGWPHKITPSPWLIPIPRGCPREILDEVTAAFNVFFFDYSACLNHIRQAIELFLSDINVPETQAVTKAGTKKYIRRSLHNRIGWLETNKPKLADMCRQLMAVKHLGNAGSHPGMTVGVNDVFDGFDILEIVLEARYGKSASQLAKIVREINRRKGPRKTSGE